VRAGIAERKLEKTKDRFEKFWLGWEDKVKMDVQERMKQRGLDDLTQV
jgi:hypothetical protein